MRRASERGQAMVEFAIAASLLLFLIFGVVEFGRALFTEDLVAHAARYGTRYAIVNANVCTTLGKATCEANIVAFIKTKMSAGDAAALAPTPKIEWQQVNGADCYTSACWVKVTVSYPFTFVTLPLPAQTLSSTSQVEIAQ